MRIHNVALLASLLGVISSPAPAADATATLRTALGNIPETALATSDPTPVAYLDVAAMARAENGALSDGAMRRLSFGNTIRPLGALRYGLGKTWTDKAGIAFGKISYFAGHGMPPARLSYWGLADETAAGALLDTLQSRGFREVGATPRMLANGEPRAISLAGREPDNPWRGELGQTSFVVARKDAVIQASAPEDFQQTMAMAGSLADNPAMAAMLDGLDRAPAAKDAGIVQAVVITPLFGLAAIDSADLLMSDPKDMEATRKKIEARMAESAKGIPPYVAGIIADVQLPSGPALLVTLAYPDCATADIAVSAIQARWKKGFDLTEIAGIGGQSVPADNGACAAIVTVAAEGPVNMPLRQAYGRYLKRQFNLLQIGTPEQ